MSATTLNDAIRVRLEIETTGPAAWGKAWETVAQVLELHPDKRFSVVRSEERERRLAAMACQGSKRRC